MNLSREDQRVYCEQAEARVGLRAASVEKDFWVTWTIRELFSLPDWGEHLSFKGGTSLAKAWKLIQRFSEDIDVVIDRGHLGFGKDLSISQQNKLRSECSRRINEQLLPALNARFIELIPQGLSWKLLPATPDEDPDQQTLLFEYPETLSNATTYLRPVVKIEMGARSDTEPSECPIIRPYLCEIFPDQLGDGAFAVRTVSARRTFWDKVMILHEERCRPAEKPRKKPMARHYYDVWALINGGVGDEALNDRELLQDVIRHRRMFFRYGWVNYDTMQLGSLSLIPTEEQISGWRTDYRAMFREMFFGEVPTFDEILSTVSQFELKANNTANTER